MDFRFLVDEYEFSLLRRPEFHMNMEIRVKMRHKTGPKASQVNMDSPEDGECEKRKGRTGPKAIRI